MMWDDDYEFGIDKDLGGGCRDVFEGSIRTFPRFQWDVY
jgi:hypothetical protein